MWAGDGHFNGGYDNDPFGGPGGGTAANGAFTRQFRSFPVSFIDRSDLERGDKIVLPPSALDTLARLNIAYPMVFQIESRAGKKTHCGVQEFIAEEGHANIPYWLMQNLAATEGEMLTIRNATLEKGTYVKFQPQTSDFLDIANPKAVLEATLRNFTCLTQGDSIAIAYNDKTYYINVLEVAPGEAISIVETDVNVDFAPAADAKEEEERQRAAGEKAAGAAGGQKASNWRPGQTSDGVDPAERLKKRLERFKTPGAGADSESDSSDSSDEDDAPKAVSFPGSGRSLAAKKGKSLTFGGSASAATSAAAAEPKEVKSKKKEDFKAFAGKGRSLRD